MAGERQVSPDGRVERDLADVKYLLTGVVRRDEFLDLKQQIEEVERRWGLRS
jgi:hypothetical protein